MDLKQYRDFPIHVSQISPKKYLYHVRVIGPVPGGQPRFNEKETRIYDSQIFIIESEGQSVHLLDVMKTRKIWIRACT